MMIAAIWPDDLCQSSADSNQSRGKSSPPRSVVPISVKVGVIYDSLVVALFGEQNIMRLAKQRNNGIQFCDLFSQYSDTMKII